MTFIKYKFASLSNFQHFFSLVDHFSGESFFIDGSNFEVYLIINFRFYKKKLLKRGSGECYANYFLHETPPLPLGVWGSPMLEHSSH